MGYQDPDRRARADPKGRADVQLAVNNAPARAGRLLRRRVAEAAAEPLFFVTLSFIGDDAQDGRERKKRAFARCGNRAGGAASIAARGEAWPRVGLASG